MYEFKTDEPILEYYSPVGNNGVPYPYAISDNFFLFFLEGVFVGLDKFPKLTKTVKLNMVDYYYDHNLKEYGKNLKNLKVID